MEGNCINQMCLSCGEPTCGCASSVGTTSHQRRHIPHALPSVGCACATCSHSMLPRLGTSLGTSLGTGLGSRLPAQWHQVPRATLKRQLENQRSSKLAKRQPVAQELDARWQLDQPTRLPQQHSNIVQFLHENERVRVERLGGGGGTSCCLRLIQEVLSCGGRRLGRGLKRALSSLGLPPARTRTVRSPPRGDGGGARRPAAGAHRADAGRPAPGLPRAPDDRSDAPAGAAARETGPLRPARPRRHVTAPVHHPQEEGRRRRSPARPMGSAGRAGGPGARQSSGPANALTHCPGARPRPGLPAPALPSLRLPRPARPRLHPGPRARLSGGGGRRARGLSRPRGGRRRAAASSATSRWVRRRTASAGPSPFSFPQNRSGAGEGSAAGRPAGARGRAGLAASRNRGRRQRRAGGGWAPRGAGGRPQPPPLPAQSLTDRGEGSFFTFFTSPLPPPQSNLGGGSPALGPRPLAGAASRRGVTGCGLSQVPLTSLPLSGLWAGETLALGAGMQEGR
ncbi:unnamed protein product [Nyctereutes procyonoides]|uniref:(raccoon dog) hypothetical protein n=1 Tax=Nyctereutes procyonoides TaxID=34880 RepID=A0A811ZUW7_NYCPR|nr:unnamed protein product [Nyctereutes procyonoides]